MPTLGLFPRLFSFHVIRVFSWGPRLHVSQAALPRPQWIDHVTAAREPRSGARQLADSQSHSRPAPVSPRTFWKETGPSLHSSCPSWSRESAVGLFADQRGCLLWPGEWGQCECVCVHARVCFPRFPVPCQGTDKHTTRQLSLAEITD